MYDCKKTIPLTLEHKSIFDKLWKPLCLEYNLQFAEYSFANVFLFRQSHNYALIEGDPPFVCGKFNNGKHYIIPSVPPEELNKSFLHLCCESGFDFFPIPDIWTEYFKGEKLTWDRADSDYLYTKEKLATLKGRKLSSRRNLIHQLERQYVMTSKALTKNEIDQAKSILETWQSQSELSSDSALQAFRQELEYFNDFELFGRIAYADGMPVGYTIGEILTPSTALMQSAKALPGIHGVTPYLYRDFAMNVPESVEWINLEQDLGIPSLRQAKEAYVPDRLLTKWRLNKTLTGK